MQKIETTSKAIKENLSKLPAFAAVARASSISRATSQVALSQSALSHLITNLESSLEVKLFKRVAHGLELTAEGKVLFDFTNRLFLDVDSLAGRLVDTNSKGVLNIKVGTHETLAAHVWPKTIAELSKREPNTKISLYSGRVDELITMLLRGDIHAAATVAPKADTRLRVTKIYCGELHFFVGKGLLKGKKSVSKADIKGLPIFTDVQAHVRQGLPIPHALDQLGLENSGQFEVSSFEAAISLAEMNHGIAVIPDQNAARAVKDGRVRPVTIEGVSGAKLLEYKICLVTGLNQAIPSLHERLEKSFR